MPAFNTDTAIITGLLFAFILPALAYVALTLPPPVNAGGSFNAIQGFNSLGLQISTQINKTYGSLNATLLNARNSTGFYAQPQIFQAFAFVINGLGTIMSTLVQIPYLDYISLNFIIYGMSSILPGVPLGFLQIGGTIVYLYMGISMLLMGVGMVMKFNPREG